MKANQNIISISEQDITLATVATLMGIMLRRSVINTIKRTVKSAIAGYFRMSRTIARMINKYVAEEGMEFEVGETIPAIVTAIVAAVVFVIICAM